MTRQNYIVLSLTGLMLIGSVLLGSFRGIGICQSAQAQPANHKRLSVVVTKVRAMNFEERVSVAGNVLSKNYASVAARIHGTLDAIYVDEGDRVEAGKTKLFQTDSLNLQRQVEIAQQEMAVAECAVRVNQAQLESIQADFDKAKIDYERFQRLYEKDKAVTKDALEAQKSRYEQLKAHIKLSKTQIELSKKQLEQARSSFGIAEKNLQDSLVYAPISGIVSMRYMEPGELASNGDPVIAIVDPTIVEISAYLPEAYYARIQTGQTKVRVRAEGVDLGVLPISYKSPTVSSDLRTFEVKCLVTNPPESLVAGRIIQADVILKSREGVGVPVDSLKRLRDGLVVYTIQNNQAKQVRVQTGIQTDGWVEVIESKLPEGSPVVTIGQDFLEDGSSVQVVEEA